MSIEIRWNRSPQQILDRILDDAAMTYAHTRLKAYCSQYVPMDSGILDRSARPTPEYLEYPGPYAHYQWMGEVYGPNIPIYEDGVFAGFVSPPKKHPTGRKLQYNRGPDGKRRESVYHPLATSHWEVAAMAAHKGDLCRDIENYLKRK